MERQKELELEWAEAQNIVISHDLVAAAKQQLLFLAEVDRNRCLYEGPVLERAIFRYKYCWLPLLAKQAMSQATEGPLVVPLDCEWIWHCHRLNPVRYKNDCMELYGRILDNWNVVSSIQGTSGKQTEKMWNNMCPSEPYEFDLNIQSLQDFTENMSGAPESIKYDLISAVKRQSSFLYQVSRPYWNNDSFLEGAVARYKGFLHLIKRNKEKSIRRFCVPTYDIDLIWHSHQLQPASYCKDLVAILGKVLEHDDTDADRTKGQKLDVGFSETTRQWEETFGSRYWKAGAMYRGSPPSPLIVDKYEADAVQKNSALNSENQNLILLPQKMVVEVMLEIVGVRNIPSGHKDSLVVSFNKNDKDILFSTQKQLRISRESEKKQVAVFQCGTSGELVFELISCPRFKFPIAMSKKVLGTTSVNLEGLQSVASKLPIEKWFDLTPKAGIASSEPISLQIALSLTPPIPAPYEIDLVCTPSFLKSSFSFLLPQKFQKTRNWTTIQDETGHEIISIQMRDLTAEKTRNNTILQKEVIHRTAYAENCLAEFNGTTWSLMNSDWVLQKKKTSNEDNHVFELTGNHKVIFFPGRKLEYETRFCGKEEGNYFMTAVEFSPNDPYGKAVALMNLKYGYLEVKEDWLVLPGILSAFIFSEIFQGLYGALSNCNFTCLT